MIVMVANLYFYFLHPKNTSYFSQLILWVHKYLLFKVVGVTDNPGNSGIQLQRVVSRCKAEFFYVSYGDTALDDVEASLGGLKMTGSPVSDEEWKETETAMNAFTIVHHDLNVCTNSLQEFNL